MLLDNQTLEVVALSAAGAAVLSLGLTLTVARRFGKLRRAGNGLAGSDAGASVGESVSRQRREAEALRTAIGTLRDDVAAARAGLSDALRHVAVVRYDAFSDMGGRLSFSVALLDDAGDGLVLTSINGRTETRTYAKGVTAGGSDHALSPEEVEVIGYASRTAVQPPDEVETGPARRRRRLTR